MPQQLEGRIALVTGASRGIGRATALALAREGAHIVAVARTVGGLEEVDDEVKKLGSAATLVPLDMRDYDGFYRLAAAINERYQRLDILIGNAAIGGQRSPLDHIEPKAWDDAFAINVTANFHLIRSMAPLAQSRQGRPRRVHHLRRRHQCARLWRALFGLEGGARRVGTHLCGRNLFDSDPRQSVQSRPDPHPHARGGHAGRRSDDLAGAGGSRGKNRRTVPAGLSPRPASSTISRHASCCSFSRRLERLALPPALPLGERIGFRRKASRIGVPGSAKFSRSPLIR